jgi:hypothetical protein
VIALFRFRILQALLSVAVLLLWMDFAQPPVGFAQPSVGFAQPSVGFAEPSAARECLDEAKAAANGIPLAGDRSAALRSVALALVNLDPQAARGVVAGMRRPSDAARSLAGVAAAVAADNPAEALLDAKMAARLLLRIADSDQREAEHRLLMREMAPLGEAALNALTEAPGGAAGLAVVVERARADPAGAVELMATLDLQGAAADEARHSIALELAGEDPEGALSIAADISATSARDRTLSMIAQRRPAGEAIGIAQQINDPLVRSSVQADAVAQLAKQDLDTALAGVSQISVAPDSARARLAASLASVDPTRALEIARGLPARPRTWALGWIAVELAGSHPDRAESLLAEAGNDPEVARLAVERMAAVDPVRAERIARGISVRQERDGALAALARQIARTDLVRVGDLVWEISSPLWRARALKPAVAAAARDGHDAATSLIGFVADRSLARRLRAEVAVGIAIRDPDAAVRLLQSLPASDCRSEAALRAGAILLAAGDAPEAALRPASIGLERDLALRWLLPTLAHSQTRSPLLLASSIDSPYLRALGLVDVAREMLGLGSRCRSVPERARQVRPIVEWEGA